MKTIWVSGTKDKKYNEEIRQSFKSSVVMRKRLVEILKRKQDASIKESRLEDAFENPNWAYKQAYDRGYEKAMEEVISLLLD